MAVVYPIVRRMNAAAGDLNVCLGLLDRRIEVGKPINPSRYSRQAQRAPPA